MTTNQHEFHPNFVINGPGPYDYGAPVLGEDDLLPYLVSPTTLASRDLIEGLEFTRQSDTSIQLTTQFAAEGNGQRLTLIRRTPLEQGFAGVTDREVGLEGQLDLIARALQNIDSTALKAARGVPNDLPVAATPNSIAAFDDQGRLVAGAPVEDLVSGQEFTDAISAIEDVRSSAETSAVAASKSADRAASAADLAEFRAGISATKYPDDYTENVDQGVTDMTGAFRDAVAAAGEGGTLKLREGTIYKVTGSVDVPFSNFTCDLRGATIDASEMVLQLVQNRPDAVFHPIGAARLETTLAADAAKHANQIQVASAAGVQPGDPIWIESDGEHWYQSFQSVPRQIINRVAAVSGNTVTLVWPLKMSFDATFYTPEVHFWDCISGFRAMGGKFIGGGPRNDPANPGVYIGNGKGAAAFYPEYVDGVRIDVEEILGFQGFGVRNEKCMDAHVQGGVIRGHEDDYGDVVEDENSGFYGVFFADSYGGSFKNCDGHNLRHMQDAAFAANFSIVGLKAYNSHRPPFGSHEGATDFTYIDNACDDGSGGMNWRGFNMTAIANRFYAVKGDATALYDVAGGINDLPRTYRLIGNVLRGERSGLALRANIASVASVGNTYEGNDAAYPAVSLETRDLGLATFTGDTLDTIGEHGLLAQDNAPRSRGTIMMRGGCVTGYSSSPVRVYEAPSKTNLVICHNHFSNSDEVIHDCGGGVVIGPNFSPSGNVFGDRAEWTPVLKDTSDNEVTLSIATAKYGASAGNLIVNLRVTASDLASASGDLKITDLPFISADTVNYLGIASGLLYRSGSPSTLMIIGRVDPNSTEVLLLKADGSGGATPLQAVDLTATGTIYLQLTYEI